MQIGIVGLPYSGKTTFFQTLTETHLDVNALQKRDTNQAIVKVPDIRLDKLNEIFNPKRSSENNQSAFNSTFLTKVRTNDAIIHVVRGFHDEAVPHIEGNIDLIRDIRTLEEEFILADMSFCETRLDKIEKDLQKQKNKDLIGKEKEYIIRWNEALQAEKPLRELDFNDEEMKYVKEMK